MMGKRVNFAARSVISPDPYIGAGEIGVPPYFALRLNFPERVTAWNVEALRRAVITGAEVLPGAVAVEDENGRVVSLLNMPKQVCLWWGGRGSCGWSGAEVLPGAVAVEDVNGRVVSLLNMPKQVGRWMCVGWGPGGQPAEYAQVSGRADAGGGAGGRMPKWLR